MTHDRPGNPTRTPRWRRRVAALLVLLLTLVPAQSSFAVYPVFDSANWVENLQQVLNTAAQITTMVSQLETMYRNLERVEEGNWRELGPYFDELNSRAQQGDALAYSYDGVFGTYRAKLPGWVVMEPDAYDDVYKKWTAIAIDTFAASLDTASAQAREYESTQEQLAALQSISLGVGGNVEGAQTSQMLLGHIAQEIARLNQGLAANLNAHTVYYGNQVTLEATTEATLRWMVEESMVAPRTYTDEGGLFPVPPDWPYEASWGGARWKTQ